MGKASLPLDRPASVQRIRATAFPKIIERHSHIF
jgi:hypothetical protein